MPPRPISSASMALRRCSRNTRTSPPINCCRSPNRRHPADPDHLVGLGESIFTLQSRLPTTFNRLVERSIEGETNRNLSLTNVALADASHYWVIIKFPTANLTNFTYLAVDYRFEKINHGDLVDDRLQLDSGRFGGDYDSDGDLDLAVVGGYWDTSGATNCASTATMAPATSSGLRAPRWPPMRTELFLGWADYDNDGDLDLAVAVHESVPMALYLNPGDGRFIKRRAVADSILDGLDARGGAVAWGDYDSDGRVDLMVIDWVAGGGQAGPNSLLHNASDGQFEDESLEHPGPRKYQRGIHRLDRLRHGR